MTSAFDTQFLPECACGRLEPRTFGQEQGIEKPSKKASGRIG